MSSKAATRTEADILAPVVQGFAQADWDVLTERAVWLPSIRQPVHPDAICVKGETITVIEGKTQLDDTLIEQCRRWTQHAHMVWAVCPHPGKMPKRAHVERVGILHKAGIGLMYTKRDGTVEVHQHPLRWLYPRTQPIIEAINGPAVPDQVAGRPSPMGRAGGQTWKRFEAAREYVAEHGPTAAKFIPGLDKQSRNELRRLAERGELEATGLRVRDPNETPWVFELDEDTDE